MRVIVNAHVIDLKKENLINENECNITRCYFSFSEEYTEDLVKIALFSNKKGAYKQVIINNECDIPCEVLKEPGDCLLGVYAYKSENDKLIRYSPKPFKFSIDEGSYREDAINSSPITATEYEQYMQAMNDALKDIPNLIKKEIENYDFGNINLDDYVKKVEGKDLSSNDFTDVYKIKLDNLNNYDDTSIKKNLEDLNKKIEEVEKTPGIDGKDGVGISSITSNEDSSLTITLSDGSSTTTVPLKGLDGKNGKDGEQGIQGLPGRDGIDGINGQDGYTPVKGTDYWTETDINDIKQHCSDYIDENYLSLLQEGF